MAKRIIMHLDLDYFFAQVEERKNPTIAGKPVVVCIYTDEREEKGAVSTANYVARKFGVHSGMPVSQAKWLLIDKDAVFLAANHALYEKTSYGIRNLLLSYADGLEQASIDEFYLDISNKAKDFEDAKELVIKIKNNMLEKFNLTCSVGIGPNKLIAKIAAGMKKPDGLTVITYEKVQEFLENLEVERIPGIGKKTKEYLQSKNIFTIKQLRMADFGELAEGLGKNAAGALREAANGIDNSPVEETKQKQLSRITTLKKPAETAEEVKDIVKKLCEELVAQLALLKITCRLVGINVVDNKMKAYARSKMLPFPTNNIEIIEKAAQELCRKFFSEKKIVVRRIGVRVEKLESTSCQKNLTSF